MKLRAYAPASIGNFAAGFDLMGAALAPLDGSLWGDVVTAETAAAPSLTVTGPYAAVLPADPWQNLVMRTYALFREELRRREIAVPAVAFELEKNLPRCSGLGSSSSSVVATLAACQALLDHPLSTAEVWELAGRAEALVSGAAHLDNVVPCLSGGSSSWCPTPAALPMPGRCRGPPTSCWWWPPPPSSCRPRPAGGRCRAPSTCTRRSISRRTWRDSSLALDTGDRDLLRRCLRDPLAEPYRAPLVPGFRAAQAAARGRRCLGVYALGIGTRPLRRRRIAGARPRRGRRSGEWVARRGARFDRPPLQARSSRRAGDRLRFV